MQDFLRELLRGADIAVFAYFVALNSSYLLLIGLAAVEFARHLRRARNGPAFAARNRGARTALGGRFGHVSTVYGAS